MLHSIRTLYVEVIMIYSIPFDSTFFSRMNRDSPEIVLDILVSCPQFTGIFSRAFFNQVLLWCWYRYVIVFWMIYTDTRHLFAPSLHSVSGGCTYREDILNRNTVFGGLWASEHTNCNKLFFDWKMKVISSSVSFIYAKQLVFFEIQPDFRAQSQTKLHVIFREKLVASIEGISGLMCMHPSERNNFQG